MAADRLILVRHGRTASNAAGVWQGHLDTPLDEVGHNESHSAATALCPLEQPSRIVSSDLKRAMATAAPMAAAWGLQVELDPQLREVNAGAWEGLGRAEIHAQWPDDLAAWKAGHDVAIGGAERMSEAGARVARRLTELVTETDGTLVVVSHGGAIRMAVLVLLGLQEAPGRALRTMRNAHWAVLIRGASGTFSLDGWNLGPELTAANPAMP
ncbi:MAG: histidine phosphatase family protein [Actinomycetales bacterium]